MILALLANIRLGGKLLAVTNKCIDYHCKNILAHGPSHVLRTKTNN